MSRVFVSPLATPFHLLVSIFPIPSRYISIFHAPSPRYFSPSLILRLLREVETTGTFKYKKTDLKRDAYDPARVSDKLFVRLPGSAGYQPLDAELYQALQEQRYRF